MSVTPTERPGTPDAAQCTSGGQPLPRRGFLAAGAAVAIGAWSAGAQPPAKPAAAGDPKPQPPEAPEAKPAPVAKPGGPVVIASSNGIRSTARAMELLRLGYDPADAIVQGIRIIEDDPNDDSVGYGGLPNEEGVVELDASVMHGPTHKSGAVAGLRNIKNPAQVALSVLRRTNHCLLVGEGALRFARAMGFQEENLLTEAARLEWVAWRMNHSKSDDWLNDEQRDAPVGKTWDGLPWQDARAGGEPAGRPGAAPGSQNDGPKLPPPAEAGPKKSSSLPFRMDVTGTVHCSALTSSGDIASCTSTSGLNWKMVGRVGDSPIIGAGNYCDNAIGAAGCTGRGESVIVNLAAYRIVELMGRGIEPTLACLEVAKVIVDHNREKRHRMPDGRPDFQVKLYALRKDGAVGGGAIFSGAQYAVCDGNGARLIDAPFLYERR